MELWVGCVAGALSDTEYQQKLAAAGFESVDIEATRIYNVGDAHEFLKAAGIDADSIAPKVQDKFISAFVRTETCYRQGVLRPDVLRRELKPGVPQRLPPARRARVRRVFPDCMYSLRRIYYRRAITSQQLVCER